MYFKWNELRSLYEPLMPTNVSSDFSTHKKLLKIVHFLLLSIPSTNVVQTFHIQNGPGGNHISRSVDCFKTFIAADYIEAGKELSLPPHCSQYSSTSLAQNASVSVSIISGTINHTKQFQHLGKGQSTVQQVSHRKIPLSLIIHYTNSKKTNNLTKLEADVQR